METYELIVGEDATDEGFSVTLYNEDGIVEVGERISYEEFDLASDDRSVAERRHKLSTDVEDLDLQVSRNGGAFEFRVLGNRRELFTERVADSDWGLAE